METASGSAELHVREDLRFQRREWRRSRVLWTFMLLVMSAAAVGLFGRGVLSHAERSSADGALRIEFERFTRYGASTRLTVHVHSAGASPADVVLDTAYLRGMRISNIVPAPVEERPTADGVVFRFAPADGKALQVYFDLQPVQRFGLRGAVRSPGHSLEFYQFIYP